MRLQWRVAPPPVAPPVARRSRSAIRPLTHSRRPCCRTLPAARPAWVCTASFVWATILRSMSLYPFTSHHSIHTASFATPFTPHHSQIKERSRHSHHTAPFTPHHSQIKEHSHHSHSLHTIIRSRSTLRSAFTCLGCPRCPCATAGSSRGFWQTATRGAQRARLRFRAPPTFVIFR